MPVHTRDVKTFREWERLTEETRTDLLGRMSNLVAEAELEVPTDFLLEGVAAPVVWQRMLLAALLSFSSTLHWYTTCSGMEHHLIFYQQKTMFHQLLSEATVTCYRKTEPTISCSEFKFIQS